MIDRRARCAGNVLAQVMALAAVAVMTTSCARSEKAGRAPSSADTPATSDQDPSPSAKAGTVTPPASPAAAPPPADQPAESLRRREVALRSARTDVEQAQRELDLAMSDCTSACRALVSMERATGHLCDLAADTDDRARCEDAKTSVRRARDRIRALCTACSNGTSLEKSAPIPSQP